MSPLISNLHVAITPFTPGTRLRGFADLPRGRLHSFGQTRPAQAGKEALAIGGAGEWPVETLVCDGQAWHAPQQFVER